jgi:hypothetical protein
MAEAAVFAVIGIAALIELVRVIWVEYFTEDEIHWF